MPPLNANKTSQESLIMDIRRHMNFSPSRNRNPHSHGRDRANLLGCSLHGPSSCIDATGPLFSLSALRPQLGAYNTWPKRRQVPVCVHHYNSVLAPHFFSGLSFDVYYFFSFTFRLTFPSTLLFLLLLFQLFEESCFGGWWRQNFSLLLFCWTRWRHAVNLRNTLKKETRTRSSVNQCCIKQMNGLNAEQP